MSINKNSYEQWNNKQKKMVVHAGRSSASLIQLFGKGSQAWHNVVSLGVNLIIILDFAAVKL